ncbi:MAG TPA: DUF885 domain-containing protein [Spongiibacteraceae bacterium]|nr:DUF885 domain-containing protein [Spongiibacteraceae bacterium]
MSLIIGINICHAKPSAPNVSDQPPLVADSGFAALALHDCQTDLRYFNQVFGWQVAWPSQWASIVGAGASDTAATATTATALTRWREAPAVIDTAIEILRRGIDHHETAPRPVVLRVYQQVSDLTALLAKDSSPYLFASQNTEAARQWNTMIREAMTPAMRRFEVFLQHEYLPAARTAPGLSGIANGEACFTEAVTWWSTLSPSAEDIETTGTRLLDETRNALLASDNQGAGFSEIMERLRAFQAHNPTTSKELVALSAAAIKRADAATSSRFSHKAGGPIEVVEMPAHIQGSFPAGRYVAAQSNEPAAYSINPSRPQERRLMAEVIAFHEAIPGHHLYFTYPRQSASSDVNAGIVEGWAIYTEYLADEMGLYSSTLDRQGMIAKHLWAASRLLVEPGLHLHHWSRERAIQFMLDNTLLSRTEIEIEVDRYIAMPGQSLSYMLGANLIMEERERAHAALGEKFDIAAFHDVILANGGRPLPVVRADIRRWVSDQVSTSGNSGSQVSG